MNSTLIKVYGFFAGVSLLAFLLTGQFANAEVTKPGLTEAQQTRALILSANMNYRAEAMNARLVNFITRIRFNAGWMKDDRGQDFPEAEAHLVAAEELIQKNKTSLETLYNETYASFTSIDPKSSWPTVRDKYVALQENLRVAHQHIADSLFILSEGDRLWQAGAVPSNASTSLSNASSTN